MFSGQIDAVIWDLDGTLIDSPRNMFRIALELGNSFGVDMSSHTFEEFVGMCLLLKIQKRI